MAPNISAAPEELIGLALKAVRESGPQALESLDALPSAVYATDTDGRITYFNQACIAFAGRTPVVGEDRWCVTWKLYEDDGRFLPHDRCPMAIAIKEKRPVRDVEAIAERPDGSRVRFRPYPTPLLDDAGEMVGAINMLFDLSDSRHADHLRKQAQRCRRLAKGIDDKATKATLLQMAEDYERRAGNPIGG